MSLRGRVVVCWLAYWVVLIGWGCEGSERIGGEIAPLVLYESEVFAMLCDRVMALMWIEY